MARTPPQLANLDDEPTIIIDPSLYVPQRPSLLCTVGDFFVQVARGVVVVMLAGATLVSVTYVVRYRALAHRGHEVKPLQIELERKAHPVVSSLATTTPPGALVEEVPTLRLEPTQILVPDESEAMRAMTPVAESEAKVTGEELMSMVRDGRRALVVGRLDDAEKTFQTVLALRPNHPAALSGMARVSLARGQVEPALAYAQRSVDVAPYQATYHRVLGDVLRVGGDAPGADAEYELAARLSPQKPIAGVAQALPPNPF